MFYKFSCGYGMKKILTALIAFWALAISQHAAAQLCHQMSDAEIAAAQLFNPSVTPVKRQSLQISFPSKVTIRPDLPNDSVIASGLSQLQGGGIYYAVCGPAGGNMAWTMTNPTLIKDSVYRTNVDGVGLRLTYVRPSGNASNLPFPVVVPPSTTGGVVYVLFGGGAHFKADLIKTGSIANNVNVLGGAVGSVLDELRVPVIDISANLVNITVSPDCRVDSSNLNIDFGTFGPKNVSTTSGPSRPVNFKLTCSGAALPATSVIATLSGPADPTNISLIQNYGTARNLAIQLQDVGTGTVLAPNNPSSQLRQIPVGGESQFALRAQVLRVGATAPTAGTISSIATITLDVQ